jgi:LmbE family N-acetylglucosaminyl deacetylase
MTDSIPTKPALMAVLAHPDDESFGMGGTLALYARKGYPVHLVCATRGEAGDVDPHYLEGFDSVAERREAELRCAAGILQLAGVHFLGYRDSGMPGAPDNEHPNALAAAPLEEVAERIVDILRLIRPQVVLTFDPIGGYKHPDHIAIHRATVLAFELAGDPGYVTDLPAYQPRKLYFQVFPTGMLRLGVRLLPLFGKDPRRFGRNGDIDLVALAQESNFPIHARINCASVTQEKAAASACHGSQMGGRPQTADGGSRGKAAGLRSPTAPARTAGIQDGPDTNSQDSGLPAVEITNTINRDLVPESGKRVNLVGRLMSWFDRNELYMRAYPPPEAGLNEKDLFA